MLKSIEDNFDNPEVNELLTKHFIELRAASPAGEAALSSIKCLVRSSLTSGLSKLSSIDFNIYTKVVI